MWKKTGPDPGFAKRRGRVSKLRENWLIWPKNRLNLHDLVVKKGGGGGAESAHTWIRPWRKNRFWPQNYSNLTIVIIACVQITLTLVNKWPRFKYILSVSANAKDHSVLTSNTHTLTNHTEIQNHLTRKYEKLATRIVQLAKYELNWTRKLKLATRNSQLELATRTRNSQLEFATRNLQLATRRIPRPKLKLFKRFDNVRLNLQPANEPCRPYPFNTKVRYSW